MKKMLLFISLLLMASGINTFAQDRQISGIVTSSEDNSPLPGVNIAVRGTNRGTTTGADGSYKISVDKQSTLVFSFVGFQAQTINVVDRTNINVALTTEVGALEEVVVTALGITREKKNLWVMPHRKSKVTK